MSDKIDLLPGEEIVLTSDRITLTTKRVRYGSAASGSSRFVSMALEAVASCSLTTKSSPFLLLVGFLSFLVGLAANGVGLRSVTYLAAVVLVLAYFVTRKKTVCIGSKGGEHIVFPAGSMKRESIIEIFNAVEREKLR